MLQPYTVDPRGLESAQEAVALEGGVEPNQGSPASQHSRPIFNAELMREIDDRLVQFVEEVCVTCAKDQIRPDATRCKCLVPGSGNICFRSSTPWQMDENGKLGCIGYWPLPEGMCSGRTGVEIQDLPEGWWWCPVCGLAISVVVGSNSRALKVTNRKTGCLTPGCPGRLYGEHFISAVSDGVAVWRRKADGSGMEPFPIEGATEADRIYRFFWDEQ